MSGWDSVRQRNDIILTGNGRWHQRTSEALTERRILDDVIGIVDVVVVEAGDESEADFGVSGGVVRSGRSMFAFRRRRMG